MAYSDNDFRGPYSEADVFDLFDKNGVYYKRRPERYNMLVGSPYEQMKNPQYWVAYHTESNKPIAVHGVGEWKNVYLGAGLASYGKETDLPQDETEGAGQAVANYVVSKHGDKPFVIFTNERSKRIFNGVGFSDVEFDEDGSVVGQDDVPEDVVDTIERLKAKGNPSTAVRKLLLRYADSWFVGLKV